MDIKCTACNGVDYHLPNGLNCPVCLGTGRVNMNYTECSSCNGTGVERRKLYMSELKETLHKYKQELL